MTIDEVNRQASASADAIMQYTPVLEYILYRRGYDCAEPLQLDDISLCEALLSRVFHGHIKSGIYEYELRLANVDLDADRGFVAHIRMPHQFIKRIQQYHDWAHQHFREEWVHARLKHPGWNIMERLMRELSNVMRAYENGGTTYDICLPKVPENVKLDSDYIDGLLERVANNATG